MTKSHDPGYEIVVRRLQNKDKYLSLSNASLALNSWHWNCVGSAATNSSFYITLNGGDTLKL